VTHLAQTLGPEDAAEAAHYAVAIRNEEASDGSRYVRETDKWSKSGLRGVLHRAGEAAKA
jgi:hypothetical protein